MSIHVALNHKTQYKYDRPVLLGSQVVRLRPAPHCRTRILSYSLRVTPEKHFINWQQDPQSNFLARLVFSEKTREFVVEVDLVAEMSVLNPFDFFLEPSAERSSATCCRRVGQASRLPVSRASRLPVSRASRPTDKSPAPPRPAANLAA